MDKIQLKVKNNLFGGWENVRVKKSMQSICHTFSMDIFLVDAANVPIKGSQELSQITNNDLIEILVNDKIFFTGYLDNYSLDIADKKKPLKISGRSKAMDLVDCNIEINKQYSNINAVQIITDLISSFDIKVSSSLKLEPLESFKTKTSETYFNAINRLCKQTNTLPVSKSNGEIELIKNKDNESSSILKDADFKSLKYTQKYNNRYNKYTYKKESAIKDIEDGSIEDSQIKRFRPFVGNNNEDKTNVDMATWKKDNDISKSISLSGTILNWNKEINTIQKLETQIINKSFLIKDIEYIKGNNGTISNLTFVDKNLFKDEK